jgi:ABC-2 type transport system permease protein
VTVAMLDRRTGAGASLDRVLAVAHRHALVLQRSPHRLFDVVLWPVVDTVLFGSIGVYASGQAHSPGGQVAIYLMVGIVLWHVVYQAQIALATGLLEETWSRNLLNLMATPLKEWEYVAGVALFGLVKLVVGVGAVVAIAWGAYSFHVTTLGWGLVPIVAILLVVGWLVALFVIGLVLRYGSGAEALAWGILFVVMPLSGVFYPVSSLPVVLRPISEALPTTHAFAAGRSLATGNGMRWSELWLAAGTTFALTAIALAYLTWMLRIFRRRGYVTRYS